MDRCIPGRLADTVRLRDVTENDLPTFFQQQLDPAANHMAAFTSRDPEDEKAFSAHFLKILTDDTITIKTILYDHEVAGHIAQFGRFNETEVSYWIGKEYWGRGEEVEEIIFKLL
jgi:RimJ/RimL family protein N-acetyltransferase